MTDTTHPDEWAETVSGQIYHELERIALRDAKKLSVTNKGGIVETFSLGDESATVMTRLVNSTVAADAEEGEVCIEAFEYRRFGWWKEAVTPLKADLVFLDTPLVIAGSQSGLPASDSFFKPSLVVHNYQLASPEDRQSVEIMKSKVRSVQQEVLSPLIAPDYNLVDYAGALRLVGVSPDAIASRFEENHTYTHMLEVIKGASAQLADRYQQLRR